MLLAGFMLALASGCIFDGSGRSAAARDGASDVASSDVPVASQPEASLVFDIAPPEGPPPPPCAGLTCPLGCHPSGLRCSRWRPSNFQVTSDEYTDAAAHLEIASSEQAEIDTDSGRISRVGGADYRLAGEGTVAGIVFRRQVQVVGAPEVGAFVVARLTIHGGGRLTVKGSRPLGLYVTQAADINGELVASAVGSSPGAGGRAGGGGDGAPGEPCYQGEGGGGNQGGSGSDQIEAGGGGGGRAGPGGRGGDASGYVGGGAGGITRSGVSPLYGGCGGGSGGGPDTGASPDGPGGGGGGGGGAIQISCDGRLAIAGRILVAGGGGTGGVRGAGGGAGGSGGVILLEGSIVALATPSVLAANGGGGGAGGGSISNTARADGQPGLASSTRAAGGASVGQYSGPGGAGGAGTALGGVAGASSANGGGGGGAAGMIKIITPQLDKQGGTGGLSSPPVSHDTDAPSW